MEPDATLKQTNVDDVVRQAADDASESLSDGDTRLGFLKKAGLAGGAVVGSGADHGDAPARLDQGATLVPDPAVAGDRRVLRDQQSAPGRGAHSAPLPCNTVGTVSKRIFRFSNSDRVSTYRTSRSIISEKVVRLRPLTCQRPVMPGRTAKRR